MERTMKAAVLFCGLAAAVLVAGCAVKLPSSAVPAFRLTPPAERQLEDSQGNQHSYQTEERARQHGN
jgi:hypothetical protein